MDLYVYYKNVILRKVYTIECSCTELLVQPVMYVIKNTCLTIFCSLFFSVHSANSCILLWVADWLAVINLGTTELIERLQIVKASNVHLTTCLHFI
jgi:hypothetical protein